VVRLSPEDTDIHLGLGVLYEGQGESSMALTAYRRFLKSWSGNRQAADDVKERIARLTAGEEN
jgi:lipopolysaccharide biosynthesis regulator YciM